MKRKSTSKDETIIFVVFLLAFLLTIFIGCKKKEQSQDTQQTVETLKTETTSEKIDLNILYAGLPNTDRAKDFVGFLKKHFKQVETTDYTTFTGNYTSDFDVAIIDHNGIGFRTPRPNISRQYSRATVTMGVPGAFICSNLSLKTGYL